MTQVTTGVPNLPTLPSNTPKEIVSAFNALKAWFSDVSARGGLLVSGTASTVAGGGEGGGSGDAPPTPPALSNLQASGGFDLITLTWDEPAYPYDYFVEIWRSSTNDIENAVNVGMTHGQMFSDKPPDSRLSMTYYYWARIVNATPEAGPWNAGQYDGVGASTADEPGYVIELLLNSKWKPSTGYVEGFYAYPTKPNGYAYFATVGGTSGETEPVWPTTIGNTVEDGDVTWRCEVNMDLETPFVIGVVGGVVKMVISDALIEDLSVTDAKIASLNADKLTAGEAAIWEAIINTGKLGNAFIGDYIESNNYEAGEEGWHINKDGLCEFHNGVFRGTVIVEGDHGANANLLPCPDWYHSMATYNGQYGWYYTEGMPQYHSGWNHAGYFPVGINTFWMGEWDFSEPQNMYLYTSRTLIPATPGKYYCLSGYTGAHRCKAGVFLQWIDSNGDIISNSYGTYNDSEEPGGTSLSTFKRIHSIAQAPGNAAYICAAFQKFPTYPGQTSSYMFVARPQLEEVHQYQLGPSPWKPGAFSTRMDNWEKPGYTLIDGNKIYTGDAYVDTLQIKGQAVTIPIGANLGSAVGLPQNQWVTVLMSPWFDPSGGTGVQGGYILAVNAQLSAGQNVLQVYWSVNDHVHGAIGSAQFLSNQFTFVKALPGAGNTYVSLALMATNTNTVVGNASIAVMGGKR